MARQVPEGVDEYLKLTKLCDHDNEKLREKAREIIKGAVTPKETALKIFYFVRDEILFGIDYPDTKASHTLKKGVGFCITKTNLQIALLRAVGIPARCHYVRLSKEALKDIAPRFMYEKMTFLTHPWCECYLSGKWIACEALFDETLFEGMLEKGLLTKEQMPTIDWNGETELILTKHHIIDDFGAFPSWDDVMMEAIRKGERGTMPPTNRLFGWFIFSRFRQRMKEMRKR